MISKPMVCSTQIVHLSCVKNSTISKWSKISFHLSLVTLAYHWVRPKWLLSLWYIWYKPCTYLALTQHRLQMDQNEIWHDAHHQGIQSRASKMISQPSLRSAQPCTYLASRLALSPNRLKRAFTWVSSPLSTIGCVQNDLWAYDTFGANHAPILHWH
jgi:hypothetical protein